jgi:nitrogen-specific signal transduction histidine kinase/CheY-like chemotaxis protein
VLPDPSGGLAGVATLVRDVSERERLEAQLRQSQKLESLGVLAGGVAHDFNNLLVGIMGNASLAIEQLPADSPLRPLLERVVNAGRRATDLTQRMLAYAGRAACDVQIMDLNALVQEMAVFAAAAVAKNISLHIHSSPDLPLIQADSGQVQQVIMNLLINAAEAIGERGGEVTVTTWPEDLAADRVAAELADQKLAPGRYVCLEVRDTGCGMTPETLSRIYDPFFSTKFAGRGLGLSAILGIVRAHHGGITVSSRVGEGTVFRVYFPAATGKALPASAEKKAVSLPRGSTVLVIDDEEDIREVVEAVLGGRGINVLTAEDGRRGLEVFRQHADRIDAVLLDMNMPGMSGEAVFQGLRAIRPDVKVVLSTGYSEQEAAIHFADVPLAGFVHKPYTASALVDKIGSALASG